MPVDMGRFPDQESCIDHLERVRWRNKPVCPHCESKDIVRKKEDGVGRLSLKAVVAQTT
jgi:hypothetical protein